MAMASAHEAQPQKLPAGLAGVLNKPDDHRDSAYYSSRDVSSKHNSTQSNNGASILDPRLSRADSSSATDTTPSPVSNGPNTHPLNSPASGAMSVASIVSPTSYNGFNHQFYDQQSQHNGHGSFGETRRESVDSRLGANFGEMRLASSPYASANPSTTSLQSTLAQQRNPGSAHPDRNSGPFRLSSGYQPNFQRLPDGGHNPRNAPQITGPASGAVARAPEPTRGQAWAFPEEDVQRIPSAAKPGDDIGTRQGTSFFDDSRRNSYADSIASSQYTTESRLPAGQRRLEDGTQVGEYGIQSPEFSMSTHHHSLQHRQVSELANDEGDSPNSSQPYSRTPELRVSHKLAERKRRLEMKDLFDNLRSLQNVERGAKASKWEILSKAIVEHERQTKIIDDQKRQLSRADARLQRLEHELDAARRETNELRTENSQMRSEITALQGHSAPAYHPPPPPAAHSYSHAIPNNEPQQQLPPLRSIPGPEIMNGVQYHDQRTNAYRPAERF
ncbi:hypothetical protein WAI453_010392 [Rhynchosporium graminicola]|uniref:Related to Protein esc1 n=1 Tax=Rhynchosporium graminicola TaxID=2792576 RepID=A0A1E1JTU6_9HELO|nr:related to Protein esc1 [Rhynchosporium commune]